MRITKDKTKTPISYDSDVKHRGEGGLLGLVINPDFKRNNFVYLYVSTPDVNGETKNRIERHVFSAMRWLRGASSSMGPREPRTTTEVKEFALTDTCMLRPATQRLALAQDKSSLGGKILRITADGTPAPGISLLRQAQHKLPSSIRTDIAIRRDSRRRKHRTCLRETEHGPTGEKDSVVAGMK